MEPRRTAVLLAVLYWKLRRKKSPVELTAEGLRVGDTNKLEESSLGAFPVVVLRLLDPVDAIPLLVVVSSGLSFMSLACSWIGPPGMVMGPKVLSEAPK